MTSKKFREKLVKIIEQSEEFITDAIDMDELEKDAKDAGFNEIKYVAGENENEVFLIHIQKI